MSKKLNSTIRELESKVKVLEQENAQLTERAEDSLLLGLISESIQNLTDVVEVFENTLERISILKAIPYATCGKLDGSRLKPIASYSAFSNKENIGHPIDVKRTVKRDLEYGPAIIDNNNGLDFHFEKGIFSPAIIALIPFKTQVIESGIFIFMDDAPDGDRLTSMLLLLNQVVHMAVAKLDNIYLLDALTCANEELEFRVEQRTEELLNTNKALEKEILERKASEQALVKSHQTFLTVLNSMDATVYVADLETYQILFMNQCMIDAFGQDLTGEICYKVFRREKKPCKLCTNKQLLNSDGTPKGVVVWQDINPVTQKCYINFDRAINWIDDRVVRLQIATDITDIKKMEQQLQQAQKMEAIGTLAGGIAHDFNNLLMGIQGRASLMSFDLDSSHPSYEHVNAIMDYSRSASDLTKQLLGVARGGKFEVKPMDLNEILSSSATMFGRTKKEIRIHTKLHRPAPVVMVDRMQLEQVLLNLFVNAWQAMPQSGEMYLETSIVHLDEVYCKPYSATPGTYAKISVTDTGIGMDKDILPKVFDPFFSTKKKGRGTGLGLASAYGIVINHGGIITVYSEVGHGTTFNIYLPLCDKTAKKKEAPASALTKGTETILLIDDEQMITEVGQTMLEKLGYRVVVANNGEDGIALMIERGADIDLVILDMIMPGLDGGQTFDRIREIHSTIPVILSSGYSLNGKAQKILNRGCSGFIQKPFDLETLSCKVHEVMNLGKSDDQK